MSEQPTPQNIKTYHIFIASPRGMDEERRMVREFFEDYNRHTANQHHFGFEVVDWEHHSTIGMGRTQQLINGQTLDRYKDSLVLLIGLLGQRFGTPTGDFESGTMEEFEAAFAFRKEHGDWPEIKCFFREGWGKEGAPTDPEGMIEAGQQMAKVKAFREQLEQGDTQLYTAGFARTEDFMATFRPDLERWLNDPARPWHGPDTPEPPPPQPPIPETPYLNAWLHLLARECARLPLDVLDARQGLEQGAEPIRLPDVFVALKAIAPPRAWLESKGKSPALAREMAEGDKGEPAPVMELLERQRLSVLIGDPGSGKSALVNQLSWQLVESKDSPHLAEALRGRIPIRIVLRRVSIPAHAEQGKAAWLWDALRADIEEQLESSQNAGRHAGAVVEALQEKLMHEPGGLILLNGLDEVPAADQRRTRLLEAIQKWVAALPDHTRFIVTARPYAYTDPRWRLADFTPFFLTAFDEDQRTQFIEGWYEAARQRFGLHDEDLKQRVPDLLARVEQKQHLRELAQRPLLLTLIATLHASGGRLPEDRAQLYADSVELLLYQWRQGRGIDAFCGADGQPLKLDEPTLRGCLQDLACRAHKAQREQADAPGHGGYQP